MIKSDLLCALGAINDKELVLLRTQDGTLLAIDSIEIQQDEPPIFGIMVTTDLSAEDFKRIAAERQMASEREEAAQSARAIAALAEEEAFAARVRAAL